MPLEVRKGHQLLGAKVTGDRELVTGPLSSATSPPVMCKTSKYLHSSYSLQ